MECLRIAQLSVREAKYASSLPDRDSCRLLVLSGFSLPPQDTPSTPVSKIGCQNSDGTRVSSADGDCENALPGATWGLTPKSVRCKDKAVPAETNLSDISEMFHFLISERPLHSRI